jgi:transcription-repair coupling factor
MFEAPLQELVSSFAKSHADLKGRLGRIEPCGWALTIAALARQSPGPMLVLVASRSAADRLVDDLNAYLGEPTPLASPDAVREQPYGLLFPEIEMSLFDEHLADPERLQVLNDLQGGQPAIVIASLLAFLQSTAKPGSLRRRILAVGDAFNGAAFTRLLEDWKYVAVSQVLEPGQFCARGQVVDLYPSNGLPKRLELIEEKIHDIRVFETQNQLSIATIDAFALAPMREPRSEGRLGDYLSDETPVVMIEEGALRFALNEMAGAAEAGWRFSTYENVQILQHRQLDDWEELEGLLGQRPCVYLQASAGELDLELTQPEPIEGLPGLAERATSVFVVTANQRRVESFLRRRGIQGVSVRDGILSTGVRFENTEVLSDRELFGTSRRPRYERAPAGAGFGGFSEGDLVVHRDRGIGRFVGLVPVELSHHRRDLIQLVYANDDKLMVPPEQIEELTLYRGGEDRQPALSRLGTSVWQRTRARAEKEIRLTAEALKARRAEREQRKAHPIKGNLPELEELEAAFPFEETPSQLQAIEQIFADMEKSRAMDRLLCGDVGYGKTEVALRACFKAVASGLQAAVLVPTTVLAQQHFETFAARLAPLGVKMVGLWGEHDEVVAQLASGEVQLAVGTHRLLSDDIAFAKLGLLVVDEEQQFGVQHKERLRELAAGVHMLSMSATPIPRTMQLSLARVRDISLLDAPPASRRPVRTYLLKEEARFYAAAIERELERHGQVFVLHNNVGDLPKLAARIEKLAGRARVAVAHGQMDPGQLERVLREFAEREHDVLVCSTIIESGVNFPNANSIIIKDAHQFGLSQLYQIRGRVGRAERQAYCYLLAPKTGLSEKAQLRLATIREFTELGSGYQVALRDLQIRGAGDLLGGSQSGQITRIGYGLYAQLLEQALKGENEEVASAHCSIDLPVQAYIPTEYLGEVAARIEIYSRLYALRKISAIDRLQDEVADRFGRLPQPVLSLFDLGRLRLAAAARGVKSIRLQEHFGETTVLCDQLELPKPPKGTGLLGFVFAALNG